MKTFTQWLEDTAAASGGTAVGGSGTATTSGSTGDAGSGDSGGDTGTDAGTDTGSGDSGTTTDDIAHKPHRLGFGVYGWWPWVKEKKKKKCKYGKRKDGKCRKTKKKS